MSILIENFLVLCFILILVTLTWWLWFEIQKQKRRKRGAMVRRSPKARQSSGSEKSTKDSSQKRQLIRLLHGDRHAAERLISSAQIKQPGKSMKWYEEKVLHDLDRDRR